MTQIAKPQNTLI